MFEYWVRTLEMKGCLRRSPGKETMIFMLGSAVFFYFLRLDRENKKRTPLFWYVYIQNTFIKDTNLTQYTLTATILHA